MKSINIHQICTYESFAKFPSGRFTYVNTASAEFSEYKLGMPLIKPKNWYQRLKQTWLELIGSSPKVGGEKDYSNGGVIEKFYKLNGATYGDKFFYTEEEAIKTYTEDCDLVFIEDNKIFYKPHIDFTLSDGKEYTVYFETEKRMLDCIEIALNDIKTINFDGKNKYMASRKALALLKILV